MEKKGSGLFQDRPLLVAPAGKHFPDFPRAGNWLSGFLFLQEGAKPGGDLSKMNKPKNQIILREATSQDLPLLRHWDSQPHVMASDPNDDWQWEVELARNPAWREQLIAELNVRPIGFIQIIDPAREETHYWGEVPANLRAIDIWIGEKEDLGKGYGTGMMQLALERCFQDEKVTAVLIDPLETNREAHRFYERLGFRFVEKRKFGDDDCFVYLLDRDNWQKRKGK
ncbi:N/A [soil metagenome]